MPIRTPNSNQIATGQTSMGAPVKEAANALRYRSRQDDPDNAALWSMTSEALGVVQRQLDTFFNLLKQPLPTPGLLQVVNKSGAVIAEMGDFIDDATNTAYAGIWGSALWIGGTGPSDAKLVADGSGNLTITNAVIELHDGSKTIRLDPSGPIISSDDGTHNILISGSQISFNTNSGGWPQTVVSTTDTIMLSTAGDVVVHLYVDAGGTESGRLELKDIAIPSSITLDPSAGYSIETVGAGSIKSAANMFAAADITAGGDVSGTNVNAAAGGAFRVGASAGITNSSRFMTTAVHTAANGLFGTPGAGQVNSTVVIGVDVVTTSISGGIIVA